MRCSSQAKWLSPSRMRKVSPALLVISGRRWKGKSRFFWSKTGTLHLGWLWSKPFGFSSVATTFQTGEVDGEAYRHDGGPGKWQVQLLSVPQQARCGLLARRRLQVFSSAWKPGSRLSQWTRYRRVVHCLLEISRVQCFEGKANTQNLGIIYEWFEHQRFVQIVNLQLSFCLS